MRSIADLVERRPCPTSAGAIASLTLRDGLEHALAEVALLVAVAQFDGLVLAGAGPARDRGPAAGAAVEQHVDFDRRVAAAVENLAGEECANGAHESGFEK